MTTYELMDADSGNLVGSYATIEEAYRVVLAAQDTHDRAGIDDLLLLRVEPDGSQTLIANGPDLAQMAAGTPAVAR